jgi:hypothetical protein
MPGIFSGGAWLQAEQHMRFKNIRKKKSIFIGSNELLRFDSNSLRFIY